MFNVTTKSIEWGEERLTLETGKVARQADGTVIATLGETSVMANVTFAKAQKPGQDFFPLTVHYQEKYYAAGKIPGGFFKREARPSEKETLTARLIDRPIRPLFVDGGLPLARYRIHFGLQALFCVELHLPSNHPSPSQQSEPDFES